MNEYFYSYVPTGWDNKLFRRRACCQFKALIMNINKERTKYPS